SLRSRCCWGTRRPPGRGGCRSRSWRAPVALAVASTLAHEQDDWHPRRTRRFRRVRTAPVGENGTMGSARTTPGMRGRTSRLGGEPVTLEPRGPRRTDAPAQLAFGLAAEPVRAVAEPRPGIVHVPDWLDLRAQQALVAEFREWARPPAGLRHPRMPAGPLLSV